MVSVVLLVTYAATVSSLPHCSESHSLFGVGTLSFAAAFTVLMSLVHTLGDEKLDDESEEWNNASLILLLVISYMVFDCGGDPRESGQEEGVLPIMALFFMAINMGDSKISILRLKNVFNMEIKQLMHNMLRVTSVVLLAVFSGLVTKEDLPECPTEEVNNTVGAATVSLLASAVVFLSLLFRLSENGEKKEESRPLLLTGTALTLIVSSNVLDCSDPMGDEKLGYAPLIALVLLSLELLYVTLYEKNFVDQISSKYDMV